VRGDVPPDLLARRRDLGRSLLALAATPASAATVAAAAERETLTAELRSLEQRIAAASPRYAGLMLPEPIAIDEVRGELLDPQTLLLVYALGRERSYLWAISRAAVDLAVLPPRQEVEAAARAVADEVGARNRHVRFETAAERETRVRLADSRFAGAARALATTVLGPVARHLPGKRLAIVADGALHHIPWAALPEPDGGAAAAPLAARHEIVFLPSASALRELRRDAADRPAAAKTLMVVADPVLDPSDARVRQARRRAPRSGGAGARPVGESLRRPAPRSPTSWPPLPFARAEAESVLALVPPAQREAAFGFAASREMVAAPQLGHHRVVHFATHALIDDRQPELSGVVLSSVDEEGRPRDGLLTLFDLYHLRLPAVDLVVLSGCRTAVGPELRGEGLVSLARGFMFAGVPRVVVSLWDVDDRATAELMKRFYELLLRDGRTPAAALREAQIAMAKSAEWSAPYYWAGFVLQGDWR
jgi:CHAT domain-containing protein